MNLSGASFVQYLKDTFKDKKDLALIGKLVRYALIGTTVSEPLDQLIDVIGLEECKVRLYAFSNFVFNLKCDFLAFAKDGKLFAVYIKSKDLYELHPIRLRSSIG